MITEKYYTDKNEHPEDRIYQVRAFIRELENVQNFYFNQLILDLNLKNTPAANDFLFDFLYNETENIEFCEYLSKFGVEYKDLYNGESD